MMNGKEIDAQLVGQPPGWYIFNSKGYLVDGPYDDERSADNGTLDDEWVGEWNGTITDISYAPEGIN